MSNVTVANIAASDPAVSTTLGATDVTFTVADGFRGQVDLTFDVVDAALPSAMAQGSAAVDIVDLVTLPPTAQTMAAPDGTGARVLLGDAAGIVGQTDIAVGTGAGEAVSFRQLVADGIATPYPGIDGFRLEGGDDLIDLSMAVPATTGCWAATARIRSPAERATTGSWPARACLRCPT